MGDKFTISEGIGDLAGRGSFSSDSKEFFGEQFQTDVSAYEKTTSADGSIESKIVPEVGDVLFDMGTARHQARGLEEVTKEYGKASDEVASFLAMESLGDDTGEKAEGLLTEIEAKQLANDPKLTRVENGKQLYSKMPDRESGLIKDSIKAKERSGIKGQAKYRAKDTAASTIDNILNEGSGGGDTEFVGKGLSSYRKLQKLNTRRKIRATQKEIGQARKITNPKKQGSRAAENLRHQKRLALSRGASSQAAGSIAGGTAAKAAAAKGGGAAIASAAGSGGGAAIIAGIGGFFLLVFGVVLIFAIVSAAAGGFGKHQQDIRLSGLPDMITNEMIEAALDMQDQYGHPAGATIAQIVAESTGDNEGLSLLAYRDKNLFGMKWAGSFAGREELNKETPFTWWATEEYNPAQGGYVTQDAAFCCFKSHKGCIEFRSKVFLQSSTYTNNELIQEARKTHSSETMADGLAVSWATSPAYAETLKGFIKQYRLDRFDNMTLEQYRSAQANGSEVVNIAREQIGKPYVWAAEGPDSFDCSGLVTYCYRLAHGVEVPHYTIALMTSGHFSSVSSVDELSAGDIILDGGETPGHVGIYTGEGTVIHAPNFNDHVREVSLDEFYAWVPGAETYRHFIG